jgi:hypothetical protein
MVRVLRSNASFTRRSLSSRIACFDILCFLVLSDAFIRVAIACVLSFLAFVATNLLPRSNHHAFQNPISRSAVESNGRCHNQNAQAIKVMAI